MVRTNHSRGPTYAYLLTSFEGPALTASGAWRSLEELQSAPGVCWCAAAVQVQQWLQGAGVAMAREQVIEHTVPTLAQQGIEITSGGRHNSSIGSGHQLSVQGLRSAETAVNIPIESAWDMWEDRERIPNWMPWIKSVKVSFGRCTCPHTSARLAGLESLLGTWSPRCSPTIQRCRSGYWRRSNSGAAGSSHGSRRTSRR